MHESTKRNRQHPQAYKHQKETHVKPAQNRRVLQIILVTKSKTEYGVTFEKNNFIAVIFALRNMVVFVSKTMNMFFFWCKC